MMSHWKKLLLTTYNTYSVCRSTRSSTIWKKFYSDAVSVVNSETPVSNSFFLEPEEVPRIEESESQISVLEELKTLPDVSHIGPPLDFKSYNFAAFVNESNVLKKLVELGVDFYTIERKRVRPEYLLYLDLDRDVTPHIQFLIDNGLTIDDLGRYFTKNPFFFKNSLSNLQIRINYLESKKFDRESIVSIIKDNPRWLNYSTVEVDRRLGYLQKEFKMKGFEVRIMLKNGSRILNCGEKVIMPSLFEFKDVQEFSLAQCKNILINYPRVWTVPIDDLRVRLEYALVEMELPRWLIVADPTVLTARTLKTQNRHSFLKCLGRAQYDPKKPNYVTSKALCIGDDEEFCKNVAKTSIQTYNLYLKTV